MKALFFLGLTILFNTSLQAQSVKDSITNELQKVNEQSSLNGFGVAIYSKDAVIYEKGFGYSDSESKIPYKVNTVQKIASISKTLLGVALMKARSMGLLELEDDINDYLTFPLRNPYFPTSKITIEHLATHTSGINTSKHDMDALYFPTPIAPVYKKMPFGIKRILYKRLIKSLNNNQEMSMTDFLNEIYNSSGKWYRKRNFEKTEPGSNRIYSNNGAAFLALVIEKVSGMKYYDYIKKYILDPLKMADTRFDFEPVRSKTNEQASLYHAGIKVPNDYRLITYPAGGLVSSVADFSRYMSAMVKGYKEGNSILSHEEYQMMMGKQIKSNFNQGILWQVYDESIGHEGDIAGVSSYAYFNRMTGIGYVLFCNTAAIEGMDETIQKIINVLESYSEKLN